MVMCGSLASERFFGLDAERTDRLDLENRGEIVPNDRSFNMYISVKELPQYIQKILKENLNYHKKDIKFNITNDVSPLECGGDGLKYYFCAINLITQKYEILWGSWGGANIFNPQNRVDLDDGKYIIPDNAIVIKGCIGHYSYASIYCKDSVIQQYLPKPVDISDLEVSCLYCFTAFKGGHYRKEELNRRNIKQEVIDACISKGWLKQHGKGLSITTEGKNAMQSK